MGLSKPLPEAIGVALKTPPLDYASADLDEAGRFGEVWLTAAGDEAAVWSAAGAKLRALPITAIRETRIARAVGGGALVAETGEGAVVLLRFTQASADGIGRMSAVLNALARQEPLASRAGGSPAVCPRCGTAFAEGALSCAACLDKRRVLGRMLAYALPYRRQMGIAAGLLALAAVLELAPPYLTKLIVDDVLATKRLGPALFWMVAGLAGTRLMLTLMQTLRGYLGVWIGGRLMGDIRRDIYKSLMDLSLGFFDRRQTTQFIGRVNNDSEALRQFLTDGLIWIVSQVLTVVLILAVMLRLDWRLTLYALVPLPVVLLLSLFVWPRMRSLWYRQWLSVNKLNILVGDALQGIRVVKAFGKESAEKERYAHANGDVIKQTIRVDGLWQGVYPLFSLISGSGLLLVWYFGGRFVMQDRMTVGTLIAFISYLSMFFGPLQWFSQALNWAGRAAAASDRVLEIIDARPEVPEATEPDALPSVRGEVAFHAVTYGYQPHHPVLREVSLTVAPGEMIGIVGHSGAGKSTLINLLCRFYDPDQGSIRIDGIDLKRIRLEDLHSHIGVVLQETFLFDGTIAENIAYSAPQADERDIMRAAKAANAHDFIVRMPDGYDTRVGERGHRLSGGEKQRIAIARAILRDPAILILDEATASVDAETELLIQQAIARLVKGRTTFAIAHRLSTLRNADRIIVLERGRIAEIGTQEELLRSGGIYCRLMQAQKSLGMKEAE